MYENEKEETGGMTPQKVVEIYKEHGNTITPEQAEKILGLANTLARIAVAQAYRSEEAGQ